MEEDAVDTVQRFQAEGAIRMLGVQLRQGLAVDAQEIGGFPNGGEPPTAHNKAHFMSGLADPGIGTGASGWVHNVSMGKISPW